MLVTGILTDNSHLHSQLHWVVIYSLFNLIATSSLSPLLSVILEIACVRATLCFVIIFTNMFGIVDSPGFTLSDFHYHSRYNLIKRSEGHMFTLEAHPDESTKRNALLCVTKRKDTE